MKPFQNTVLDQNGARCWRAFIVDAQRSAPPAHRAVIDNSHAGRCNALPKQPSERACLLAVEIAFKPVAHGFVQQHARPSRPQHHIHFARRRGHRRKIHQRLPQRLVHRAMPIIGRKIGLISAASATAMVARFLPPVFFHHDRYVQPNQRADIAIGLAARPQYFDMLPFTRERAGHLLDPRVSGARVFVHLLQQGDLGFEACRAQRVQVGVELCIGPLRGQGERSRMTACDCFHRIARSPDRIFR